MIELKRYSAKTDQGPFLNVNEDDVDVDIINKLYLLFDGFGGAGIGDESVKIVRDNIKSFYLKFGSDPDSTFPFYYSPKYLLEGNALVNAINYSHDILKKHNKSKEMSDRGGASGICISQAENILTFVATGNCISYLFRMGEMTTVTSPDSLRNVSGDNFLSYLHSCPLSGFGLFDNVHLKVSEVKVRPGDLILLMSDGVYSRLAKEEVRFTLGKSDLDLEERIDTLFDLANDRGNKDNQSAIILEF